MISINRTFFSGYRIKPFVLGILLIGLYHEAYTRMMVSWRREDYNYCYLVPFIFLYLMWEKRAVFNAMPARWHWSGIFPVVIGVGFWGLGELSGEFYSLYLSSWLVLVGLCWMRLGWQGMKRISFPMVFLLAMFPPPEFFFQNVSLKLKLISSQLGVGILRMSGMSAYREGNVIDLGFTQLQVVDACSGLRYLIPLLVLAVLVAYFSKNAMWKRIMLVVSAIPISIVVNSLRIASVGLLYPSWGKDVAEGFFHDFSGWLIFMVSLGILLGELYLLNKAFGRSQPESAAPTPILPDPSRIKASVRGDAGGKPGWRALFHPPQFILTVLLLTATWALGQGIEFREKVPVGKPFHLFPLQVGQWAGTGRQLEQQVIDELDFSDYMVVDYTNAAGHSVNVYTAFYESQRKGESIHSPETCLPGGGWVLTQSGKHDIPLSAPHQSVMRVNRAFMQMGGHKQLVYYWFPCRGRILTDVFQLKLFTFWDALTRQRTDGALVRMVTPVYAGEELSQAEARLRAFMQEIVPVLDEFLPK